MVKQYIITEVLEEHIVSQNTFDDAVQVTVTQLKASFIESVPTGTSNSSIDLN